MQPISVSDARIATKFLYFCLELQLDDAPLKWLRKTMGQIGEGASERIFITQFSAAPRYLGKADLKISSTDQQTAEQIHSNWTLQHWSTDQTGRVLLMLAWAAHHVDTYSSTFEKLFSAADVGELVALYQGLVLLPHPDRLLNQALDGMRSNMTAVFNAIALRNPYPAEYFSEDAWNQLVLKTLFVGSPLHAIVGLDRRANPKLSRMLSDYAHERWAAGRSINPELWRVAAPYLGTERLGDLERLLASADEQTQKAGALACATSPLPEAQVLLSQVPHLQQQIQQGELTWNDLSQS